MSKSLKHIRLWTEFVKNIYDANLMETQFFSLNYTGPKLQKNIKSEPDLVSKISGVFLYILDYR